MKAEQLNAKGCEMLCSAIVAQAGVDYLKIRRDLVGLKDGIKKKILEDKLKGIERFFESRWYRDLTELDGKYLKESLDKHFEKLKSEGKLEEIGDMNIFNM